MKYEGQAKRAFDVAVASTCLIAATPALCLVSVFTTANLRESPLYLSQRPGKDGIPFTVYKLKTMQTKNDEHGNPLPNRARTTLFGALLRHTAIDEWPQLLNIVKGDMSLVGPRPRKKEEVDIIPKYQRDLILAVAPGLTGPWQVASIGRKTKISEYRRRILETSYVESGITFKKDMDLILQTPKTFLLGHDATITNLKNKAAETLQGFLSPHNN